MEPKVTDRVFTVGKAGVNNQRGKLVFKALCASFFNIQSSIFNSEVYFALGRSGEASYLEKIKLVEVIVI